MWRAPGRADAGDGRARKRSRWSSDGAGGGEEGKVGGAPRSDWATPAHQPRARSRSDLPFRAWGRNPFWKEGEVRFGEKKRKRAIGERGVLVG
eukprot:7381152-Prymnesium_polylepis.1